MAKKHEETLVKDYEIDRLNKGIQEAMEEIENYRDTAVSDTPDDVGYWTAKEAAYQVALDILRKHGLGEEGKK